jgi:hypothetical protein
LGIDNGILCLAGGIVLAGGTAAAVLWLISRAAVREKILCKLPEPSHEAPLARQMQAPVQDPDGSPGMASSTSASNGEQDFLSGATSLSQSLGALAKKYSLDEVTLATADGLPIASSVGSPREEEIARYCGIHRDSSGRLPGGIGMYDVEHRGSSLVLIVKIPKTSTPAPGQVLVHETKAILNWWM